MVEKKRGLKVASPHIQPPFYEQSLGAQICLEQFAAAGSTQLVDGLVFDLAYAFAG